jgi:hypothetical protein
VARPNPSAGVLLEGREGSARVLASGTLRVRGKEPRGAAERATPSDGAAGRWGKKIGEGARRKRKEGQVPVGRERKREEGGRGSGWEVGPAWPTRGKEGEGESWAEPAEREKKERERERSSGWAAEKGPAQEVCSAFFLLLFFSFPTPTIQTILFEFKQI